jgi:hypothetical protein
VNRKGFNAKFAASCANWVKLGRKLDVRFSRSNGHLRLGPRYEFTP